FLCWLRMVRASTVSSRSFQKSPSRRTSTKRTGWYWLISATFVPDAERAPGVTCLASGGLPHDERAGQAADDADGFAADHVDEQPPGLVAERGEVHVDAGERRAGGVGHDVPVVEADYRDLVRYGDSALAQRIDAAARDLVVAGEEAVGRRPLAVEEARHRLAPPRLGPCAG